MRLEAAVPGWTRPSSSSVYSDWASDKTFAIGDTLTFTFTTGASRCGDGLKETEISHYRSCRQHPLTTRDTLFTASASAAALSRLKSCCYLCSGVHVHCH
ncbi:hypothetical protein OIU76_010276 [Salix suchowensis]|nr:hypothetical protein OIU76_010276 [Salix suchowensis]